MARNTSITSRIMGRIKRRDTMPKLLLRRSLHKFCIRYRVDSINVYGRPDMSVMKYKLAIFTGGDFWHGNKIRRLSKPEDLFPTNSRFWPRKIQGNIQRDHQANQRLLDDGWTIIRIWASTVLLNPDEPAKFIQKTLIKLNSNIIIYL